MRVSSRADYGVRALFDLALHYGQGPTQSREIAARQGVPEAYLHQVLGALNRAGLVRSTRGPAGGHELAREPGDISLWDVLLILDGLDRHAHPHPIERRNDPVHEAWHELQRRAIDYLSSITLESLVEQEHSRQPIPNYSI
ncbi:MAG: Rrf2 family transcriptional regulator, cysteine metabolism repressor [Thermomicrobiales bacterium]|nr:Rrf2 family transcriptional regulator, cysteine metabolism repressor [Thermomicrobiales bacterium]